MFEDEVDVTAFKVEANVPQTIVIMHKVNCFKDIFKCLKVSSDSEQELMLNVMSCMS